MEVTDSAGTSVCRNYKDQQMECRVKGMHRCTDIARRAEHDHILPTPVETPSRSIQLADRATSALLEEVVSREKGSAAQAQVRCRPHGKTRGSCQPAPGICAERPPRQPHCAGRASQSVPMKTVEEAPAHLARIACVLSPSIASWMSPGSTVWADPYNTTISRLP